MNWTLALKYLKGHQGHIEFPYPTCDESSEHPTALSKSSPKERMSVSIMKCLLLCMVVQLASSVRAHENVYFPDNLPEPLRQQQMPGWEVPRRQEDEKSPPFVPKPSSAMLPPPLPKLSSNELLTSSSGLSSPNHQSKPGGQQIGAQGKIYTSFLPPKWRIHVMNIISRGITKFTLDVDQALENTTNAGFNNLLFSPASLTTTLAMVLLASSGQTFDELTRILGVESGIDISKHSEVLHRIFGLMIQESDKIRSENSTLPQCKFAFGTFVEDGYPIREQFKQVSEKVYKSETINVDFSHNSKGAQNFINEWVSNRTMNKINHMLTDPPNPTTDVIILSAMYFHGEWNQYFMEGNTKRREFETDGSKVYVDMMFNGGSFPFYEDRNLGLKIVGFPYKGLEVMMYAILPNEPGTAALRDLKRRLNPELIDDLIGKMKNVSCIIGYPKMKLSSTLRMQPALEALGLGSLFDPSSADLSLLSPGRQGDPRPKPSQVPPQVPQNSPQASQNPPQYQQRQFQQVPQPQPAPSNFQSQFSGLGRGSIAVNQDTQKTYYLVNKDFMYPDYNRYYEAPTGTRLRSVSRWWADYNHKMSLSDGMSGGRIRRARQATRPIDQEFVNFLNAQNLPSFGVDELRNGAGLRNPGLYADDVIHKVEMSVDERGTEAAAATSVILDRSGDYKRFTANRPFVLFVRHNPSKVIWFWGTINRPEPYYPSP
ncbi:hypothetical protein QAD02_023020 [Eretmocerus hayati]|uniref:Uncharacterized protein n=1 Tax=Eretmocerus hayati TaxID=131215 RepID=A0ACC2PWA9_9HYME|nr:hypothetical protein QAD02_023020 [Eretmocerus hayati]